jgi:hypothetical protein
MLRGCFDLVAHSIPFNLGDARRRRYHPGIVRLRGPFVKRGDLTCGGESLMMTAWPVSLAGGTLSEER